MDSYRGQHSTSPPTNMFPDGQGKSEKAADAAGKSGSHRPNIFVKKIPGALRARAPDGPTIDRKPKRSHFSLPCSRPAWLSVASIDRERRATCGPSLPPALAVPQATTTCGPGAVWLVIGAAWTMPRKATRARIRRSTARAFWTTTLTSTQLRGLQRESESTCTMRW